MGRRDDQRFTEGQHIGGWPRLLSKLPARPNPDGWNLLGTDRPDESDETDVPFDVNHEDHFFYQTTQNIYAVLSVFVKFRKLELYPPPWAIKHLADVFERHLSNPDPDLLASQFGVSGKGSGAQNPYQEFTVARDRDNVLTDMMILMTGFRISFSVAARAMIEKHELQITEKRLMNNFRERFGNPKKLMLKHREFDPIHDPFLDIDASRQSYLAEFPRSTLIYLKKKVPDIT